ncbi:hypothetical protein K450DRAFT_240916 [Umbelopsis ramanniana AG]|uniref:Nudix hydrolase domain-containing protein n=1 Tax=Umbelopsis ramanniana AG TaxID=1314678 RepID=A0AAD5HF42_UMBRA|nr:uncharacterized protein K450DRAFT_240916 [Umbelopsis ramanniana AG]KAI8579663.1 hypothetical protein K450DRAFT_240916 [Umbelopsis ramanniana AG]
MFLRSYASRVPHRLLFRTFTTMEYNISVAGKNVPVKAATADIDIKPVFEFQPFKDWCASFDKELSQSKDITLNSIQIQSVDIFGNDKIGFVKFKADAELTETGKKVPGIVFMRGGAVSVLIILRSSDNPEKGDRVIFTLQPRVPVPCIKMPELPAGMLDGSGSFSGTAAKEIEEETGLIIEERELTDMTELAYGNAWRGVYPSAGGCDEFLRLFLCVKSLPSKQIDELEGKLTGLRDHGESITLKLVKLEDAWKESPDAKLLSSLALLDALKKAGKL